jgi:pilus assembly protein CpaB
LKRRVLTVTLAIVLAVLGTAGVLAYVHKADSRALDGMKPVSVLVAQGQIPAGTTANSATQQGLLRSESLPASSVPLNAVRSITPGLGSLVMSAQIQSGQVLLRPMLVTAAQVTGGVALPSGMLAVSVNLCLPEAVAENIGPGSEVEVLDTFASGKGTLTAAPNCTGPHQQQAYGHVHTVVLLPRVKVLSIGIAGGASRAASATTTGVFSRSTTDPAASSASSAQQGTVLVTLAVTPAAAPRLVTLTQAGLPYLALLQH